LCTRLGGESGIRNPRERGSLAAERAKRSRYDGNRQTTRGGDDKGRNSVRKFDSVSGGREEMLKKRGMMAETTEAAP